MTGLLKRLTRVFSANAHAAVDELERPETMLNQLQRELVSNLTKANAASIRARAWQRQLLDRDTEIGLDIAAAERTAERALSEGNEAMARGAVARKLARKNERVSVAKQIARAEKLVETQQERTSRVKQELVTLREQRGALVQRARFTRAVRSMGSDLADMPEPTREVVARMEEQVAAEEATVDAISDVAFESTEPRLDQFMRDQSIDDELARLKSQMSNSEKTQ